MKRKIKAGTTNHMEPIRVYNSNTGVYLSGITAGSSGLVGQYRRELQSTWVDIPIVSGTAGSYISGGWSVPLSGPAGSYEVGIPNLALASGAKWVELEYYGASGMMPTALFFELDSVDYNANYFGSQTATGLGLRNELGMDSANLDAQLNNISLDISDVVADMGETLDNTTTIINSTNSIINQFPQLSTQISGVNNFTKLIPGLL